MVVVVSSSRAERVLLSTLCSQRGWPGVECDSVRSARKTLLRVRPRVVVVRHQLVDGYSDDVIALTRSEESATAVPVVVLATAGLTAASEARQITMGADVVYRDPIRIEVIRAQLERRLTSSRLRVVAKPPSRVVEFAGAQVDLLKHKLTHGAHAVELTPREVELVRVLVEARGDVATYELLYSDILGRPFRGETSNMRVLLGKLTASFRAANLDLRSVVEVIPKSGYRYHRHGTDSPR
jgi:DNA-binding response OmpR family regulator